MVAPLELNKTCPVGWLGCRIHRLLLCTGVRPPSSECHGYDTKQSDDVVLVMQELWGMWSTSSLPSLPGPLWARVTAPDRVQYMGQIQLNFVLMLNWIVWNRTVLAFDTVQTKTILILNWIAWNGTVYMFKNGIGSKNLQWLMCHKTNPNDIQEKAW